MCFNRFGFYTLKLSTLYVKRQQSRNTVDAYNQLQYIYLWHLKYIRMSYAIRKPALATCEQQMCRSACASAQSVSTFVVRCLDSIIHLVAVSERSSLYLAPEAEQAVLSFIWSETTKTGFLVMRLNYANAIQCILSYQWHPLQCLPDRSYRKKERNKERKNERKKE